jgi:hypothetical protein
MTDSLTAGLGRARAWLGAALVLALPVPTVAEIAVEAPLIIVMNERAFAGGADAGLIGGIIGNASNDAAEAQMAEFAARTPGVDWASLASEEFACFAVADEQAGCRTVMVLDSYGNVDELLADSTVQRAIVVELVQTFHTSIRYRARVVVHELTRGRKEFGEDRVFTALYETILPRLLWDTSVEEADRWWAEGVPSRLEADARRSLRELRELAELVEPLTEDKWSVPKEWKQLPKIGTLEQAGRARCSGLPCGDVRILEQRGDRTWLVNDKPLLPAYGPSVASLDGNALINETNLFYLISVPY